MSINQVNLVSKEKHWENSEKKPSARIVYHLYTIIIIIISIFV